MGDVAESQNGRGARAQRIESIRRKIGRQPVGPRGIRRTPADADLRHERTQGIAATRGKEIPSRRSDRVCDAYEQLSPSPWIVASNPLSADSIAAAKAIGEITLNMGKTACKVPRRGVNILRRQKERLSRKNRKGEVLVGSRVRRFDIERERRVKTEIVGDSHLNAA